MHLDDFTLFERALNVYYPLIFGSAEAKHQAALRKDKSAVNKHVAELKKLKSVAAQSQKLLKGVARIRGKLQTCALYLSCKVQQTARLLKRLTARQSDAREEDILFDTLPEGVCINNLSPAEIVGVGVMTALAVVGTALSKYGKAEARAVDDGFRGDARYSQFRHCA